MVKDQDKSKKYEEVKAVINPLVNFKPIHIEEDIPEGPMAKCFNCGKDRLIKTMSYGNLSGGGKGYLCWECFGKPYINCNGIAGCEEGGCIHLWEDLEWLSNKIDLHATYITGAECVSFSGYEICKKKIKELLDAGELFQCRKCNGYFTMELTAEAYMDAPKVDDVCASCYHGEQKISEE